MKTIIAVVLFCIVTSTSFSQRTFTWNGSVNSNFSTAGNWNPVRQVGYPDDKLVFNTGTNLNITNVYQVTIGQISVLNNTHLKLSPSSGNPRTIFIQGDGSSQNSWNEHSEISHVKYDEYMKDSIPDLAEQKYNEYMKSEITDAADLKYNEYMKTDSSYIATIKYNEYRNASTQGMGDIKEEQEYDSNSGIDLLVEQGSSLTIHASDPTLSIHLKPNATAEISGTIEYTGSGENTLNSDDAFAITFKTGSRLVQSCPGQIFTGSGTNNSVLFDSGSAFEIMNESAKDPFGLALPGSKLMFDDNSIFKIAVNNQNVLKFNGRSLPNLIITHNCNINVFETMTSDFNFNNLEVEAGGKLHVKNITNSIIPKLNIKGNLVINGELHFMPDNDNKLVINFSRGSNQVISGAGLIEFGSGIHSINIYNDLTLARDVDAYCHVIHHNGRINTEGHVFKIFSQYTSLQMIFVGIMIMPESSPEMNRPNQNNNNADKNNGIPEVYSISQNYPNPFNPKTKIDYSIPKQSRVNISVFDMTGKIIAELINSEKDAMFHTTEFDGTDFASGIYFYRIDARAGNYSFTKTNKMCLVK